jgi:membrane-bound lytic murein transglycosylase B
MRALCALLPLLLLGAAPPPGFEHWLAQLEAEALERGFERETVQALERVEPIAEILEQDRSQPTAPSDFCTYMARRLTPTRIARAQRVLEEDAELLAQLNAEYGVPPRYLVALWGLETNFGDYMGEYKVVDALATLAFDPRRGSMFREQVFDALQIIQEGHQSADALLGSWAGATGHVQFMPSTFLAYAVDHDGDGRKDVWTNTGDALASAANYLRASGWRSGETWGRPVLLPKDLANASRELGKKRALQSWQARGVRRLDGGDLPTSTLRGSIVLPLRGPGPAFLVYGNYHTFMAWNRSTFFAVSVGALADAAVGRPVFDACGG